VTDGNLFSARKPGDIPAFNRAMIELFSKGRQESAARVALAGMRKEKGRSLSAPAR